ncbi:MAG: hypothetical protein KAY47_00310 [Prevotella sp.]|nr:hypothetical protein [Prevotella sp.]
MWTDQKIEEEIFNVMKALNIHRMPSNSEILAVMHDTTLTNAIRRHGGFYGWAEKLELPTKESDTKTGSAYELYAMATMISKGLKTVRMSVRHPYDFLVNGSIKVDVKVSSAYLNNGSLVNTVGLGKEFATCDLYIIYLRRESGELDRTLIIPGHQVRHKYLNIGKDSKYNKYIDRWDLFQTYSDFKDSLEI